MKKQILSLTAITLVAGALLLTGCKKDDTTAPVVTLTGDASVTISLNSTYTDAGATAEDDRDGDITANITNDASTVVNKDLAGTYTVTYTVSDEAGNTGTATRTVIVKNDAEATWAGNYTVVDVCGSGASAITYNYSQTVTASTTVNNRVTFNKFADYSNNTGIYATITSNTIDLPSQTGANIGTASESHTFSGSGSKTSSGFTLTYTDVNNSASGASATCTATFTKQ